jgi:hypothetical protein
MAATGDATISSLIGIDKHGGLLDADCDGGTYRIWRPNILLLGLFRRSEILVMSFTTVIERINLYPSQVG